MTAADVPALRDRTRDAIAAALDQVAATSAS
jgi:hypothetical protein